MKTAIYYTLFLLAFTIPSVMGQVVEQQEIVGTWTVVQVTPDPSLPEKEKQMMEQVKKVFLNSTLEFRADQKFFLVLPKDAPAVMVEEMKFLDHKKWMFEKEKQMISTGTKETGFNDLVIYVKQINGKFLFVLSDTPLLLEMVKK